MTPEALGVGVVEMVARKPPHVKEVSLPVLSVTKQMRAVVVMVAVVMVRMVVPKGVWVHVESDLLPDALLMETQIVHRVHQKELVFGRHRIQPTMTS